MGEAMRLRPSRFVAAVAMGAALTAVATASIQIPIPATEGYINLGDTMVLLNSILFGPVVGAIAGGGGSAIADLATGFPHWAPWTLIIKGIEGGVAGFLAKKGRSYAILGTCIGAAGMVAGYFLVEAFMYGIGGAMAEVLGNVFQAISGIVFSNIVAQIIRRLGLFPTEFHQ